MCLLLPPFHKMLYLSCHSVVSVQFDQKNQVMKFSVYKYNKGKDRFKKRYEISFPNSSSFVCMVLNM